MDKIKEFLKWATYEYDVTVFDDYDWLEPIIEWNEAHGMLKLDENDIPEIKKRYKEVPWI